MLFALLGSALLLLSAPEPQAPAAMVLATQGTVNIEHDGRPARRLGVMDLLRPGDQLTSADDGHATLVFLSDGHRERLRASARATVGEKECTPASAVERLDASHDLTGAHLASLRELARSARAGVGVLRGEPPPTPQAVTPMYGTTVISTRPTLSWPAAAGADSYTVELLRGDGRRLVWRETTRENRLPYPEQKPALHHAAKYLWRVTAHHDDDSGRRIVNSKFLVATQAEADDLARLRPLESSSNPADVLVAAVGYEAHGVYDEALKLYEKLAKQSPDAAAFQSVLANYYERAGLPDWAKAARERAEKLEGATKP
jgi:hypothetical protein